MNFSRKGGKGFTFIITVIYWFRTWCLVSNSPSPNHLHLDFFSSLLMIHVFVPFTEVISVHYLINANFRPFYLSTVETNTRSSYFDASTTNGSIPYYNYDCEVADCSAPFHESFNVLYPCCFVQTIYKQKYLRMFCQWCQIWNVLPPSFRFVLSFVFQQALYELKLIEWWTFRYRCPWTITFAFSFSAICQIELNFSPFEALFTTVTSADGIHLKKQHDHSWID